MLKSATIMCAWPPIRSASVRAVAFALLLFALPRPVTLGAADDGFAKWWPQFQAAAAAKNSNDVLRGVKFPIDWELGKVRKVSSAADFTAHFAAYFTDDMRKAVATQKPEAIPGDEYSITWHARGDEYAMYFSKSASAPGGWALGGLSEGPP